MPAQWTGNIIGKMHIHGVSMKQLAAHLGYTPQYVSMVLNGKKSPDGAERLFCKAVDEIIAKRCSGLNS